MFPTENPSPCCPETSQPRISSNEEIDLCNESDNTPLPKFSIRDYVSSNRRKGIVNHWPFSSKHLQLCFKNRVNDVLPPFQSLDSIENLGSSNAKLSSSNDHLSSEKDVQKVALDVENRESFESEKDKENPSIPEVENLRDTLESYPSEELLLSTEKMASKVCPVCKTFSSSSNTTLNAHIDRCLSGESTSKHMENLKLAKHKMKPRKTRSMADIYATSMECTLEDLDRRNGTDWAEDPCFPTQEDVDEKDISFSCVNSEDDKDEDAVYVDSSGTKLRILSTFDNLQLKLNRKDKHVWGKHVETGNRSKLISSKMKRPFICRHELPKYRLSRQRNFSPTRDGYCHEVNKARGRKSPLDEIKEGSPPDRMTSGDFGMIKQWVGSRRTIAKKINPKRDKFESQHQLPRLRKRDRCSMMESGVPGKKSDLSKQLREDDLSLDKSCLDHPPIIAENSASSQSNKSPFFGTRMHRDKMITSESLKKSGLDCAVLSLDKELLSLKTSMLSAQRMYHPQTNLFSSEKARLLHMSDLDEEAVVPKSAVYKRHDNQLETTVRCRNAARMEKFSRKLSRDEANVLVGGFDVSPLEFDSDRAKISFHNPATSDVEIQVAREAFMIFGKSLESGFHDASGSDGSKGYVKGYDKCNGVFGGEQDSRDYIVDVDPIPIPGPPGSFLPSPGHTGSEELHGDSSLTACKVHSSDGEVELIDMNSLDSPISARLDSKFDESRIESISMLFRNTLPPCSRKEGVSSRGSLDHQVLAPFPSLEKKYDLNAELHGSNASTGDATIEVPKNSRPVLRLMGKNLTVVNKDENHRSPQTRATSGNDQLNFVASQIGCDGLKINANFGMPDLPPNPSGAVNSFYNIYEARCFPNYNFSQVSQRANAQAMPFKRMTENSSVVHSESLTRASAGPTTSHPRSSSLWFAHGFSLPKNLTR